MDESTAAVVDSASAAASSKTAAPPTSIKLLIKASNQQYDDQIIESDLLWTVKRLKTQLSLVYPSKPPVADQKLIYSGKLLSDNILLKDIIRSYKDVYTQNHILHLVCNTKLTSTASVALKPKNSTESSTMSTNAGGITTTPATAAAAATTTTTTDGLRQRHVAGSAPTPSQQQQRQRQQTPQQEQQTPQMQQPQFAPPQFMPQGVGAATQFAGACPQYNANQPPFSTLPSGVHASQFGMHALATQQVAMYNWMQHVYSQYMEQYMRHSNAAAAAGMANMNRPDINMVNLSQAAFQQLPFAFPNAAAAAATAATGIAGAAASPVIPFPSAASATAAYVAQPQGTGTPLSAPQVAAAVAAPAVPQNAANPAQAQPQQAQRQVVAPRFPNIVQEEQENRDWLDSFFSITRLAIFLTILYFNSSPLRCVMVVIIAGVIYLYHIGVIRFRYERNNNNINRNNNADADQIRQGVQQVQQAQDAQQQQQQQQQHPPQEQQQQPPQDNPPNPDATEDEASATNRELATDNSVAAAAAETRDANSASVISFIRTFVVTFFTSLLPETPAAL